MKLDKALFSFLATHKITICLVSLAASILILAPLIRSGKTAYAATTLELLGLALLTIILWNGGIHKAKITLGTKLFVAFSIVAIAAYLIPLPDTLWHSLPNRLTYNELLSWLGNSGNIQTYNTLSLAPLPTISVLLSCLPALALFLTTVNASTRTLKVLIYFFLLSATIQASIGLGQYFTHIFPGYFDASKLRIVGTYLNTNHFTAFMEMAEPIALALLIYSLTEAQSSKSAKNIKIVLFATISLLLTFLAYTTTSRMGTALLILSILISFWAMTTPNIRKKVALPIFSLRLALLGAIILTQYQMFSITDSTSKTTVLTRVQPEVVFGDLRWDMFSATWEGAKAFLPFGSGPGTMPQIVPAFLPEDNPLFQAAFINHAHNDYLELFFETGFIGLIIIVAFMILYIAQWKHVNQAEHSLVKLLQSGAGIGILIFLIFSLTDFNLHTPANALSLSFLCGVFFRKISFENVNKGQCSLNNLQNQANDQQLQST